MRGQIDCVFADPASAQGLVQDGKLRALAVTSSKRLEDDPGSAHHRGNRPAGLRIDCLGRRFRARKDITRNRRQA
jgi:hypothetical protein